MKILSNKITGVISPCENNPRNSEGSFITLDDGRIAFAYSRFLGSDAGDNATCTIAVVYSLDQGDTWDTEHPQTLVSAAEYNEKNVMSVTMRRMDNKDIGLFYGLKRPGIITEGYLRRYKGDFSHPCGETRCYPIRQPGYYVQNNDRVVRHSDGTWIIPTARHASYIHSDSNSEWLNMRGTVHFFYSKDDGVTWQETSQTVTLNDPYSSTALQEPGLVELPGGTLYGYFRTDRMYQYESFSMGTELRWTEPRTSRFTSPDSPMLIKQNPFTKKYYAIWNPVPNYPGRPKSKVWTGGRTPLVIAESEDGINFCEAITLEDDPEHGYCYPAMYFQDAHTVLLAYCSGGPEDQMCLCRTTLRKLVLE